MSFSDDSNVHRLTSPADALPFLQSFSEHARRTLDIFSATLPPALYDDEQFVTNVSALSRRGPQSKVRVLVRDTKPLHGGNRALIKHILRLPSRTAIKQYVDGASSPNFGFICIDRCHLIYFADESTFTGFARANARAESRNTLEEFNTLWTYGSKDDPDLRQFLL